MNFNTITNIDETRLEKEWVGQADRYMEVVQVEAAAARTVDELKEKLEVTEAKAAKSIRDTRESAGQKYTEKEISTSLALDPGVVEARADLRQAEYDSLIVRGARSAMDHRRSALENLVKLQMRFANGEPRAEGATREEVSTAMSQKRMAGHETPSPKKAGCGKETCACNKGKTKPAVEGQDW